MIKIKNIVFFIILLNVCLSYAQESRELDSIAQEDLDAVVLTATRTKRQVSALPMPVQVIKKEQIQKTNVSKLDDILNETVGLVTVLDFGGGEGIQMQGFDSEHILVMIDGVPLIGRKAGTLDISQISVGNIEQIEI